MPANLDPNLAVGAILFVLGAVGVLTRRNLILIVLSAEMMLHGVALTLVTFSQMHGNNRGQIFTVFVLTVAACEAGLALSLVLSLYQRTKSLDINLWTSIREPDVGPPAPDAPVPLSTPTDIQDYPRLTPAGGLPELEGSERTLLAEQTGLRHTNLPV
ncbi:MAG TPA: NADH-quinone oxidoreductase subunit NuoK [Caulifigura sp.]|nr:NADH-quinone oxidoreductase subunit NuoK [Caulifigura sp.]